MIALIRLVISESARFPELRERTFNFGTLPVLTALLGMIATVVFWPRLIHGGWSLTEEETRHTIDEAARTIVARYGTNVNPN